VTFAVCTSLVWDFLLLIENRLLRKILSSTSRAKASSVRFHSCFNGERGIDLIRSLTFSSIFVLLCEEAEVDSSLGRDQKYF
jgi:hypothetical protein